MRPHKQVNVYITAIAGTFRSADLKRKMQSSWKSLSKLRSSRWNGTWANDRADGHACSGRYFARCETGSSMVLSASMPFRNLIYSHLCVFGWCQGAVTLNTGLTCADYAKPQEKSSENNGPKRQSHCWIRIKTTTTHKSNLYYFLPSVLKEMGQQTVIQIKWF